MTTLHVKLFGSLAHGARRRELDVDVPDGATGSDVLAAVESVVPQMKHVLARASLAVNLEVSPWTTKLHPSDEIALLPPASGGEAITVVLSEEIAVDEAVSAVLSPGAGGIAVFVGTVRDHSDAGDVDRLDYTAYDEMAVRVMREVASEALEKWGLSAVAVRHAVGSLGVGRPTMVVACAAAHRDEAFDACRYVVDELKQRAPIWKQEFGSWGDRFV
jgi:molybdopterin synthase catalytic subunit